MMQTLWPLVGREAELERIAAARRGGACGVVVSADAGIGKSRLAREALVADVLARLAERRFLAVVGASGSGKSSFIRAGLIAAIWRGALPDSADTTVVIMTPGERPLEQLAMRLALLRGVAGGSLLEDLRSDASRRMAALVPSP